MSKAVLKLLLNGLGIGMEDGMALRQEIAGSALMPGE